MSYGFVKINRGALASKDSAGVIFTGVENDDEARALLGIVGSHNVLRNDGGHELKGGDPILFQAKDARTWLEEHDKLKEFDGAVAKIIADREERAQREKEKRDKIKAEREAKEREAEIRRRLLAKADQEQREREGRWKSEIAAELDKELAAREGSD